MGTVLDLGQPVFRANPTVDSLEQDIAEAQAYADQSDSENAQYYEAMKQKFEDELAVLQDPNNAHLSAEQLNQLLEKTGSPELNAQINDYPQNFQTKRNELMQELIQAIMHNQTGAISELTGELSQLSSDADQIAKNGFTIA